MKIAVAGIGGVGGYLAGMLGRQFPHLTLGARGARGQSLRENGLILHSDNDGEITVHPERVCTLEEMEPQNILFLCVKNYSLEEACAQLKHAVSEDTILVPVMNGVDCGDRVRQYLDRGIVLDSLIYIVTFAGPDYSITQQGDIVDLHVGTKAGDARSKEAVQTVDAVLRLAGIKHAADENIELEIWRKYILNCAYNVETAYYNTTIGPLREDPVKAKEYEDLIDEACAVARAKGIPVTQAHRDYIVDKFYNGYGYDASSSLQRDVAAGRRCELDTFSGYLVREARRLGVPAPVSEKMYEGLQKVCR